MILTPEEDRIVQALGQVFNSFLDLPVLHPSDAQEFCAKVHDLQRMILARPAIRSMKTPK